MCQAFRRLLLLIFFLLTTNNLVGQGISAIIEGAPNQEAFWAVSVRAADGTVLEEFNPDKLIIPASNQKLYTTAAVLDGLGSDFRYATNIYGQGVLEDGIWKGDVIIQGVGDPSISGTLYEDDRFFVFRTFADQLKDKGITKIEGTLIADVSYFDDQVYPPGWDWYDMSFYYGVEISALSFNNNAIDLVVNADGDLGEAPKISWFPDNTEYVEFVNMQKITAPETEYDEYYQRDMGQNRIVLRSSLPQGYLELESLSVFDAPTFFVDSFEKYLASEGIEITQLEPRKKTIGGEWELLASHTSKHLSELVERVNKKSDNFYAEMLLKTLAAEKTGNPGSFEAGVKEVRHFMGELGVDTTYVTMKDGSGMAMGNYTKTSVMSDFLVKMQTHPEFQAFKNSFPISGVDGSLAYRMKDTALRGDFLGKTGYVTGVRTLSGYLTTASGKTLSVSLATNNFIGKLKPIDRVHEQILLYLYEKY